MKKDAAATTNKPRTLAERIKETQALLEKLQQEEEEEEEETELPDTVPNPTAPYPLMKNIPAADAFLMSRAYPGQEINFTIAPMEKGLSADEEEMYKLFYRAACHSERTPFSMLPSTATFIKKEWKKRNPEVTNGCFVEFMYLSFLCHVGCNDDDDDDARWAEDVADAFVKERMAEFFGSDGKLSGLGYKAKLFLSDQMIEYVLLNTHFGHFPYTGVCEEQLVNLLTKTIVSEYKRTETACINKIRGGPNQTNWEFIATTLLMLVMVAPKLEIFDFHVTYGLITRVLEIDEALPENGIVNSFRFYWNKVMLERFCKNKHAHEDYSWEAKTWIVFSKLAPKEIEEELTKRKAKMQETITEIAALDKQLAHKKDILATQETAIGILKQRLSVLPTHRKGGVPPNAPVKRKKEEVALSPVQKRMKEVVIPPPPPPPIDEEEEEDAVSLREVSEWEQDVPLDKPTIESPEDVWARNKELCESFGEELYGVLLDKYRAAAYIYDLCDRIRKSEYEEERNELKLLQVTWEKKMDEANHAIRPMYKSWVKKMEAADYSLKKTLYEYIVQVKEVEAIYARIITDPTVDVAFREKWKETVRTMEWRRDSLKNELKDGKKYPFFEV